jgi:hypothetical protein
MSRPTCFVETCDKPTSSGLCAIHRRALTDRLDSMRTTVDELNTQLTRQARYSVVIVGDGEGPVVWNEGASRTLARVVTTMSRWDALVHDRIGTPTRHPNPIRAAREIRAHVTAGHLDTWPPLATMLIDLEEIAARTLETIDRPKTQRFLGICTAAIDISLSGMCDTRLYAMDDVDTIQCPSCGTTHLVDADLDLLLTIADDTLVTATQAARAMSTRDDAEHQRNRLVDRISTWERRSRVTARGTITDAGRERKLYRLGDIRALVTNHDRTTRP